MERRKRFGLVLSLREKAVLEQLAELGGGLSEAALVRRLIRNEARKHGLWPAYDQSLPQTKEGEQ